MNPLFRPAVLFASLAFCLAGSGCVADAGDENADLEEGNVSEVNEAIAESFSGPFHSPTGKNYCWLATFGGIDSVRCEWQGGGDWAMELDEGKRGRKVHVTD